MICSSVEDNWMRVEIMHFVAKNYFDTVNQIKESNKNKCKNKYNLIDLQHYMPQKKESCIVGMIKAWCVVTLESLANHAIAEKINNKTVATLAIEFPGNVIQKFKFSKKLQSDLSKKLFIINDGYENIEDLVKIADDLVSSRNLIIHDKPYKYNEFGDGEIKIEEYRTRGNLDENNHKFSNLKEFYQKCDKIAQFLISKIEISVMFSGDINFCNLLKD